MNVKVSSLIILLVLFVTTSFGQEKSKKQIKEEEKIEQMNQTEILVNSKEFVFVAKNALPQGEKMVNLTSNPNYVKFLPDFIDSYMPFFGKATSNAKYSGDVGLKFKGKPEEFTVTRGKKNFEVKVVVKEGNDSYQLMLTVFPGLNASLYINSINRSPISYDGDISPAGNMK